MGQTLSWYSDKADTEQKVWGVNATKVDRGQRPWNKHLVVTKTELRRDKDIATNTEVILRQKLTLDNDNGINTDVLLR